MPETLWNRCLRVLESELPIEQFNTWLRPLQAIERDGEVRLLAPNPYVIKWVGDNSLAAHQAAGRSVRRRAPPSMWCSMWEPAPMDSPLQNAPPHRSAVA